jgi:hypothetical protein
MEYAKCLTRQRENKLKENQKPANDPSHLLSAIPAASHTPSHYGRHSASQQQVA